jgi:hypothetical protein
LLFLSLTNIAADQEPALHQTHRSIRLDRQPPS